MKKFWSYNNYFEPPVSAGFQLTLGEGSTPVYTPGVNWSMVGISGQPVDNFLLAKTPAGVRPVDWLRAKREFANPTGSHKDRSFAYWISYLHERGAKELVIASSGNSAISAAAYCKSAGSTLQVFVSTHLAAEKKEKLLQYQNVVLHEELLPRKLAIQFATARNIPNLLASKHDEGTEGYKTIAFEIAEQVRDVTHIFVPTSSGATLQGMYGGFEILHGENGRAIPKLFAVQTTKVHPIAEVFDSHFITEAESHAQAIVDRVAPRRSEIIDILKKTNGGAYVISNRELEEAKEMLQDKNLGWQSILAFAGFVKFRKEKALENFREPLKVLCLFTDGRNDW